MAKRTPKKTAHRRDSRAGRKHERRDGYYNEHTGHGTDRDRRSYTSHQSNAVTEQLAMSMWRTDDIMARIIEMLPRESTRRGFTLKVASKKAKGKSKDGKGKEIAEQIMAEVERLDVLERLKVAGQYERAYGGAAIFPVLTGAVGELHEPLDSFEPGIVKIEALHILEARELRPASWYRDIEHPKFRQPETYRLWPLAGASGVSISSEIIHESRLITFPGIRVSNQLQPGQRPGWGDSIVSRCYEVVADFGLAWGSAATLLHEFALGVLKMDKLTELLATAGGKALVQEKLATIEMAKSTLKVRVIDAADDYQRESTPVSGLEGLLIQLAQRLAAAADMPVTQLMGMSPAGMNATGESDTRGWYDRVSSQQGIYRSIVEWIVRLIMLQNDGPTGGAEPETWSTEWNPLWQPSEKETAETRNIVATTDKTYFDMGAVTGKQVAESRWGGDTYSADMHYDVADLEDMDAQENLNGNPADLTDDDLAALGKPPIPAPADAPTGDLPDASELLEIVKAVIDGEVPRAAAIKILGISYKLDPATAEAVLGPADFQPPTPNVPPALAPFTGLPGAQAKPPAAKPADGEKTPPAQDGEPVEAPGEETDDAPAEEPAEPAAEEPDQDEDPAELVDEEPAPKAKKKAKAKKPPAED